MRKWLSFVLVLALLLPVMGVEGQAAQTQNPLKALVQQQYREYVDSLGKPNASTATSQLLNFAISGRGKYQKLDERDAVTVALLNSALYQDAVITAIWDGTVYMQARNLDALSMAGGLSWYRAGCGNWVTLCPLEPDGTWLSEKRDTTIAYHAATSKSPLNLNDFDQTMIDLVGGSKLTLKMQRIAVDMETVTYRVSITVADGFNFDGNYSDESSHGDSTDALISKFGMLLTLGLIDTYDWESTAEFSITVPNTCPHSMGTYRWEFDGIRVTSAEENALDLISEFKQDGTAYTPYYKLESAVHLRHDSPWVVEMRMKGNASFRLSGVRHSEDNTTTLSRGDGYVDMILSEVYHKYNSSGKAIEVRYHTHKYGVKYNQVYKNKDWHTYRIENRINADGSNMIYLLIDGDELGPMDNYRYPEENINGTRLDWFNGRDMVISYLKCNDFAQGIDLDIDYIQVWENGEGSGEYSYLENTTNAPTCTEPGKIVHTCSLCGASYSEETGEGILGHAWGEGVVTTAATCTTEGVMTYICVNDPSHTRTEVIPATGHSPVTDAAVDATCTTDGLTEGSHCGACNETLTVQERIPSIGHSWDEGNEVTRPSVNGPGTVIYTCTACGELRGEEIPYDPQVTRLAGAHRYETAFKAADQMKVNLGIEKFDAVVVASGTNFADALSGSYLAAVKNAPILLACDVEWVNDLVKDYIKANLKEGGTVYILGGEGAVPASFETNLDGFTINRLAGDNRFLTNLKVLEEAGVSDQPILVCTGLDFADSLSASAAKLPILLVYGDKLMDDQTAFLKELQGNKLYILGGEGAVSGEMQTQLSDHGAVRRIGGENRFETSVLIAETFFESPKSAVLAYAWNFPDGLCGGSLAASMNAPMLLTMERYEAAAAAYAQAKGIQNSMILGGDGLIPDASVRTIFALNEDTPVTVK